MRSYGPDNFVTAHLRSVPCANVTTCCVLRVSTWKSASSRSPLSIHSYKSVSLREESSACMSAKVALRRDAHSRWLKMTFCDLVSDFLRSTTNRARQRFCNNGSLHLSTNPTIFRCSAYKFLLLMSTTLCMMPGVRDNSSMQCV